MIFRQIRSDEYYFFASLRSMWIYIVIVGLYSISSRIAVNCMGTHILHAGPSCIIQSALSPPVVNSLTELLSTANRSPKSQYYPAHHPYHLQNHHSKHHRGICYSSMLCKQKGGVAMGKCGLGNACCIFPQSCNSISVRNSTYFTNVDYPAATRMNQSADCSITIHRMPGIHPITKLRLDFIEYDVGDDSNEANKRTGSEDNTIGDEDEHHGCANDRITLRAMHSEEDIVPPICSRKIGQHAIIDVRKHIGPFVLTVHAGRSSSRPTETPLRPDRERRWNILVHQLANIAADGIHKINVPIKRSNGSKPK